MQLFYLLFFPDFLSMKFLTLEENMLYIYSLLIWLNLKLKNQR